MDLPTFVTPDSQPRLSVAMTAANWPGPVSLYSSAADYDYRLALQADRPSSVGQTLTPLAFASGSRTDRGPDLLVRMVSGQLESVTPELLRAGRNQIAIGDGTVSNWEVLQFETAELVAPETYALRARIRGLAGTDGTVPSEWPAGSYVVVLDESVQSVDAGTFDTGVTRHFRWASALVALDSQLAGHAEVLAMGAALRPFKVAHLKARVDGTDHALSWVRRLRGDNGSWSGLGAPSDSGAEQYRLRLSVDGSVVRTLTVPSPVYLYTQAQRAADGVTGTYSVGVSQLSSAFGAGPESILTVAG